MNKINKIITLLFIFILILSFLILMESRNNKLSDKHLKEKYNVTAEKIIIHYNENEIELTNSSRFEDILSASINAIKSIDQKLRMPVPNNLKERIARDVYVEVIFAETTNITTKYGKSIEADAVILTLAGEYKNVIFTGERGYIDWKNDTGYFVKDETKDVLYMSAWKTKMELDRELNKTLSANFFEK